MVSYLDEISTPISGEITIMQKKTEQLGKYIQLYINLLQQSKIFRIIHETLNVK